MLKRTHIYFSDVFYLLNVVFCSQIPNSNVGEVEYIGDSLEKYFYPEKILESSHKVNLPLGFIQGKSCPTYDDVSEFLGVPYALPPLNENRFRTSKIYAKRYPTPGLNATTFPSPCGKVCSNNLIQPSEVSPIFLILADFQ